MSDSQFSDALAQIYGAALDPGRWETAAHAVRKLVGAHSVNLCISDIRQTEISRLVSTGFGEGDGEIYESQVLPNDDIIALLAHFRPQGVGFTNTLTTLPDISRLRAYEDFYKRIGYFHFGVILINESPTHRSWVSLTRAESELPFKKEQEEVLRALKPHLERALEINRILDASRITTRINENLIECLRVPLLLLAGDGRVVERNQLARDAERRGTYSIRQGRACLRNPEAQVEFASLIHGQGTDTWGLRSNSIALRDGTTNGRALICPIAAPTPGFTLATETGCWAVFLLETTAGFSIPGELLKIFFDLSPAEIAVVSRLIAGANTREITHGLGITGNTLRSHLKNIYRKTGTGTQSQLVAMLAATFPLTIDNPLP